MNFSVMTQFFSNFRFSSNGHKIHNFWPKTLIIWILQGDIYIYRVVSYKQQWRLKINSEGGWFPPLPISQNRVKPVPSNENYLINTVPGKKLHLTGTFSIIVGNWVKRLDAIMCSNFERLVHDLRRNQQSKPPVFVFSFVFSNLKLFCCIRAKTAIWFQCDKQHIFMDCYRYYTLGNIHSFY